MPKNKKTPQDHKKKRKQRPVYAVGDVTSAKGWKRTQVEFTEVPLDLPSGNTALVRPVGAMAFLEAGLVPNSLVPYLQQVIEAAEKGKELSPKDTLKALKEDPDQIAGVIQMTDAVTCHCVVRPPVQPVPPWITEVVDGEEVKRPGPRAPDLLYVDQVDIDDKLFIMQFALGGTRQLEPFRAELAANVASLSPSSVVEPASE